MELQEGMMQARRVAELLMVWSPVEEHLAMERPLQQREPEPLVLQPRQRLTAGLM